MELEAHRETRVRGAELRRETLDGAFRTFFEFRPESAVSPDTDRYSLSRCKSARVCASRETKKKKLDAALTRRQPHRSRVAASDASVAAVLPRSCIPADEV